MTETFHLRRFYRNLGIAGLVLSAGMILLFVDWLLWGADAGPWDRADEILVPGVLVASPIAFAWMLLVYVRGSLTIADGCVVKMGAIRTVEIRLVELVELRWWAAHGGRVLLRSGSQLIVVDFASFEREDWTKITRLLRWWAPPSLQKGWEQFCYLVALPRREQDAGRPAREDEMLVTRARHIAGSIPAPLLVAGVLAVPGLCFHGPNRLPAALIIAANALIWWPIYGCFQIPAHGTRAKALTGLPRRDLRFLHLLLRIAGYASVFLYLAIPKPLLPHREAVLIVTIVWGCVELLVLVRGKRRLERDCEHNAAAAAEEWERLEREGGAVI